MPQLGNSVVPAPMIPFMTCKFKPFDSPVRTPF